MENKIGLKITSIDIIFMVITFVISIILAVFIFFLPEDNQNAKVCVYYDQELIEKVDLYDQNNTSPRYIILFKNEQKDIQNDYKDIYPTELKHYGKDLLLDDLVIQIKDGSVSIIKETSPQNICSELGEVSRPNAPLICAPNYVKVVIQNETDTNDGDTPLL